MDRFIIYLIFIFIISTSSSSCCCGFSSSVSIPTTTTTTTTTLISGHVFDCDFKSSTSRNLLQDKKNCPVSFEFLNYTIITSQCKGPKYPPEPCCNSFKQIACPYTAELNDLTNDCATTLFSYINLYGKYPPGLFANQCREGKLGLECPSDNSTSTTPFNNSTTTAASSSSNNNNNAPSSSILLLLIILIPPFLI